MIKLYKVMSTPYNNESNIDLPELPDGLYYPFKRLPGTMLFTYAFECIEVALKHALEHEQRDKQAADCIAAYQALVESWDLPGCRARIDEMAKYKEDFSTWQSALNEAVKKNKPLPDWPWEWANVLVKTDYNADFHELVKRAYSFVLIAFNRKLDIENETPKIVPGKSLLWLLAIAYSLIVHYLPYAEVEGPAVLAEESVIEYYRFCAELPVWPGSRPERWTKTAIRQTLKREGYRLKHYTAIQYGAEMWYRARVLCDKAREAADYYCIDPLDLSERIKPYDEATGWPRSK
jgi:hypothetical protein